MSASFNIVDLIFFSFTIIFVLTAFFRGFVKEVFALFSWIIALTLSYLLAPFISDIFSSHFDNKLAVDISARSIIFIASFFIAALSTSSMRDSMKEKISKDFDRSLGVLFGLLKTLIIFGFIYSLYFNLYGFLLGNKLKDSAVKTPDWLSDAKCYGLLKISGEMLDPLVKKFFDATTENFDHILPNQKELLNQKIDEIIEKNSDEKLDKATPDGDSANSGYSKKDIEKMNHLIEILDK